MNPPFDKFDPRAAQWRTANALALAHAADLAYEDDADKILRQLQNWGFPAAGCRVFTMETAQALAAANEEMMVFAFRGTQPGKVADWLVDAEVLQDPWRQFFSGPDLGRVHHGFARNTARLWDLIREFAAAAGQNGPSLWVSGHSLGGAMAVLAGAALFCSERQPVRGIYTFGQPRAGNPAFARRFGKRLKNALFRVVNNDDLVPHVPPVFIPFLLVPPHGPIFYRHAVRLFWFDAAGKLHPPAFWSALREAIRFPATRRRSAVQLRSAPAAFAPISDHSLASYIQKLQAWLDAGNH
ncbi:MAG: lipase family protein [Verrucomicrobiota bacterium]|nr:lipase family protein [Verrucomicrobiota bacterium]